MKKIIVFSSTIQRISLAAAFILFHSIGAFSQIVIGLGVQLITTGNVQVVVNDLDLKVAGQLKSEGSTFHFTGNKNNSISSPGYHITFAGICINKTTGRQLVLLDAISVTGTVNFMSGNIELNRRGIDLNTNGSFIGEKESSRATGVDGGWIKAATVMNTVATANIGNLGATIGSSGNMGMVTVVRRHHSAGIPSAGGKSIYRNYEISTAHGSANSSCRFSYFDAELNGINESNLTQYKRTEGTPYVNWQYAERNAGANYVLQNGYSELAGIYTLSAASDCAGPGGDNLFPFTKKGSTQLAISSVMPNPVTDAVKIIIPSAENNKGMLVLYNGNGQQVMQQAITLTNGINQYQLNLSGLVSGTYNLVLVQGGAVSKSNKLIKL